MPRKPRTPADLADYAEAQLKRTDVAEARISKRAKDLSDRADELERPPTPSSEQSFDSFHSFNRAIASCSLADADPPHPVPLENSQSPSQIRRLLTATQVASYGRGCPTPVGRHQGAA